MIFYIGAETIMLFGVGLRAHDILAEFLKVWMVILTGTLVDILGEEKLVTCKNSMDILADFFHR